MQLKVVHKVSPKSTSCQLDEGTDKNCDQQVSKVDQKNRKFTLHSFESFLYNYHHHWVHIIVQTLNPNTLMRNKKTYSL